MKKGIIIGIILFVICAIGGIGTYFFVQSKQLNVSFKKDVVVSLNDVIYNTDYIDDLTNGEIVNKKEVINTKNIGVQTVTLTIRDYFGKEKDYSFDVKVIDDEKPVIKGKDKYTTEEGTKIDLLKDVTVTDNSGEEIKASIDGKYDFNKPGTYSLKYVAKDSSGNEATKDFELVVTKKVVVVQKVESVEKTIETKKEDTTKKSNSSTTKKSTTTKKTTTSSSSGSKPINGTSSSLNGTKTSKGYTITVKNGIAYINGIMIANKTYALPKSYAPGGLTSTTRAAANEMIAAAKKDGVSLYIASGYRSYATQDNLWTKRKNKNGIAFADSGTARPGHSEHQTGLAFDMCGSGSGCITSEYHNSKGAKWMAANAYKYGLILRYPNGKAGITGYKYESWHFRYVGKDLAAKLYNGGNWITLEEYFGITSKYSY